MKVLKESFRGLGVAVLVLAIAVVALMPVLAFSALSRQMSVGDFIGSAPSWLLYTMFASMWIVLGFSAAQFVCYTHLEDQNKALKTTYDQLWRERNKLLKENHKLETELDKYTSENDDEYEDEYFGEEENDDSILTIRVRMYEVDANDDEQPEASSPCCGGCPCRNAAPANNEAEELEELEEFLNGLSSAFDAALRSSEPRNAPRQGWYTTTITSNITT